MGQAREHWHAAWWASHAERKKVVLVFALRFIKIKKNMIKYKIKLIDKFYRTHFNKKPKLMPYVPKIDT